MQERHLKGRGIPVHFFEETVPQGGAVKGILVFNPAMGTKAKFYAPLAQAFAEQGYHVMVHELAHHFGWSDDDIASIDRWWE